MLIFVGLTENQENIPKPYFGTSQYFDYIFFGNLGSYIKVEYKQARQNYFKKSHS